VHTILARSPAVADIIQSSCRLALRARKRIVVAIPRLGKEPVYSVILGVHIGNAKRQTAKWDGASEYDEIPSPPFAIVTKPEQGLPTDYPRPTTDECRIASLDVPAVG
tara:strand:- start:2338 stop:2661 length:324 start_codon:yes stop_codon:yes gene_type:complete